MIGPSEDLPNPIILSLSSPEDTEISVLFEKTISKFEAESGDKVDRSKPITAFLMSNSLMVDEYKKEGTYYASKIRTFADLKKTITSFKDTNFDLKACFEYSVKCTVDDLTRGLKSKLSLENDTELL